MTTGGGGKRSSKLSDRLSTFEKKGGGKNYDNDGSMSPDNGTGTKSSKGKKTKDIAAKLFSPTAVKFKEDQEKIFRDLRGSVQKNVSQFNLQESMNEEYMRRLLEDKQMKKEKCRKRHKKAKKKAPNPVKASLNKNKAKSDVVKKNVPSTSTASVWKNRKASMSITVDPKTYKAPNNMAKATKSKSAKDISDTRKLIEEAMEAASMFFPSSDPLNTTLAGGTAGDQSSNKELLINAFESIEYNPGTVIGEEKDNEHFYVVQEGQVDIKVNGNLVRTANKGETFGELNLLYSREDEKAVMIASGETDTKLLRLNQKDYREIMQVQTKQEEEEKRALLKKVPFLKKLLFGEEKKNEEIIKRLCSIMIPNQLEKGDPPLEEEDASETLYIVKDGNIQLTSTSNENFILAPGDYIGKKPMMGTGKEPTVLRLEAPQSNGLVYSIKRSMVDKVLGPNFFSRHQSRMQDRAKLEKFECIASAQLDPMTMETITESVVDTTFDVGKKVFKQGDKVEPCLYMVREGSVILSTDDGSFQQEVGPGGYFGVEQLLVPGKGGKGSDSEKVLLPAEWNVTVSNKMACVCGVLDLAECQAILDNQGKKLPKKETVDTKTPAMKKREEQRKSFREKPFSLDDLDMLTVLGDGEFGEVWLVSADVYGKKTKFALKIQNKKHADVDAIKREITATKTFNHPFIVNLVTSYETDDSIYMLLGLVSGGELWDVIHKEDEDGNWHSGITEYQSKFYGLIIADTLGYIHSKDYVFRDLKPENVMLDKDGYPILVDFGFAKMVTDKTYTCCGTPNYVAPEIIWNTGHNRGVDYWALGVLIYEMVSGEHPFFSDDMDQMALYHGITELEHYPLPDTISQEVVNLTDGLLIKEPSQRLGMLANKEKDILNHEWFEELDLEQLRSKKVKAPYIPPAK